MTRYRQSEFWVIVWVLSVLCLFEAPIRSLGRNEVFPQIGLLPGLWLSDIGILFPIFALGLSKGFQQFKSRVLFSLALVTAFGMCLAMINNNSGQLIVADLRILTCFVTGYAMIAIAPTRLKKIVHPLMTVSILVFVFSIVSIYKSDRMHTYVQLERITDVSVFIISGIVLSLISPIMTYIWISRKGLIEYIFITLFAVHFALVLYIMQARALAGALLLSVMLSIVSASRLKMLRKAGVTSKDYTKGNLLFLFAIFAVIISFTKIPQQILSTYTDVTVNRDASWVERDKEMAVTLRSLDSMDLFTGKGLGPNPVYFNRKGEAVGVFHIGILNVVWRFGFIVFGVAIVFIVRILYRWLGIVVSSRFVKVENQHNVTAVILCSPGLFTLVFVSLISGGWSQSSFLSVGMLYGVYKCIQRESYLSPYPAKSML